MYVAKEKVDFAGKEEHFEGKKRENWHPYDRRSGTGRGREVAKGGHGKGNWGGADDVVKAGEEVPEGSPVKKVEVEGEVPETTQEEGETKKEAVEERPRREEIVDPEDEANKSKMTLQDYLAQKKKVNIKKETRQHEEVKKANVEELKREGNDRIEAKASSLRN